MKSLTRSGSPSAGAAPSAPQRSKRSAKKDPPDIPDPWAADAGSIALLTGRKVRSDCVLKNLPRARQEEIMAWCEAGRDGSGSGRGGVAFAREQLATEGIEVAVTSLRRFCAWFQQRELLEQARDSEDLIDLDPVEIARAHASAQKLLLDLALAERSARLLALATAAVDRQRRLDLQSARDTWRQRQRERQWTQTVALREKSLQLARDRFKDSKLRYERAHQPPRKPTGLTPEVLRQIEEAAKLL